MNILIDLDNVLADFEKSFYEKWESRFPERKVIKPENRNTFYIYKQYPDEYRDDISSIYNEKGFIENLPVIEGAIEAVNKMDKGHNLFICTSPLSNNLYSASEKMIWVNKYLGKSFSRRTIITKDKTQIKGDILIDDRPEIEGKFNPSWKHVLFDKTYNRNIKDKPRMNWGNWEKVLPSLM